MLALGDCTALAEAGKKALRLAQARALGVTVPDGLVLLADDPLPSQDAVVAALSKLDPNATRFVVRSSAQAEDRAGQSAAGLFHSVTNVPAHDVQSAIEAVRQSGSSDLVSVALGGPVPVAVLIQPQVPAARLGVLYRSQHGDIRCEERDADTPEWSDVTVTRYAATETCPTSSGAATLSALIAQESTVPVAIYAEYAVTPSGQIVFLQARPAPAQRDDEDFALPTETALTYVLDKEHNPDPLSSAQQGLVDVVADLVPWLRQRAVCGYLYWAVDPKSKRPTTSACHTRETFHTAILPTCEAILGPLERRILAKDGALSDDLLADPSRCELTLPDALHVYRSIYSQYVGQLGPAIKHARAQLDGLLQSQLGEPLSAHGSLLSGIGGAQTDRVSLLWQLGRDGCPPAALRHYLARFGAFSSCWDVLIPCDDEQPHAVSEYAQHLARLPSTPSISHALSLAHYHDALQKLLDRLPRLAKGALKSLLPTVRDAMVVAEDDDLLFFRAQRLVRWALLGLGARLHHAGQLESPTLIFDLPWQGSSLTELLQRADRPERINLSQLAEHKHALRIQAKRKIPPGRIAAGRPEWTLPDGQTLSGTGISTGVGVVSGVALVVSSLDDPSLTLSSVMKQLTPETILVLPTLLPSWAPAVWGALAVVTDSGGSLSHGAILARERGIPAVLGTRIATQVIASGQSLLVDGQRGLVVQSLRRAHT
jgi:phosphohistidine swiveling domain-containing protein